MKFIYRIYLLIFITITASALVNLFLIQHQQKQLHKKAETVLVKSLVHSLKDALVQDVIEGKKLRVTELLQSLKRNENPIEFIYVRDDKNMLFAHSFMGGFPQFLVQTLMQKKKRLHKFKVKEKVVYVYAEPLIEGLDMALYIGINQSEAQERYLNNQRIVLIVGFGILVIALLIAFYWGRKITIPLTNLTKKIQSFADGKVVEPLVIDKSYPDIYFLSQAFDEAIAAQLKAHMDLKDREEDLSITLSSIGDAVIATDNRGMITRLNPIAEKLTGWKLDEAIGQSVKTVFPIVDATTRLPMENPIEKVLATGETVYLTNHTTLISKDSTEYQIADSAAPIRDESGKIFGMVLVFHDVTQQYYLREKATKTQYELEAIMNNSPAMIYVKDIQGKLSFANSEFLEFFDKDLTEVLDKSTDEAFSKELGSKIFMNDEAVSRAAKEMEFEEVFSFKGEEKEFISVKFPLRDEDKQVYAICSISTDVTERKKQEVQLRQAQKMDALGKLTGGISHDFNNILGIIMGYCELLELKLAKQPKEYEYVKNIHTAGDRGVALVKKLLSFSRKKASVTSQVNINTILRDSRLMLEKSLTARIELLSDLADDLRLTTIDVTDFEDAVLNLCINAMHAIDENGKITLRTYNKSLYEGDAKLLQIKPGNYVVLSVIDTGSGMDQTTVEKVFEPFFTTKGEKGTGLGLSQVYGFIERSEGMVKVYSEVGEGTRFDLYFPQSNDKVSVAVEPDSQEEKNLSGTETILVVDDEEVLLDFTKILLMEHGYKVIATTRSNDVMDILNKESVDLLISDIIMPEMDGYQLARKVLEKYPQMKIQLISGFSDDRHINMVDPRLHEAIVHKPFSSVTLLRRLRKLLDSTEK